MIPPLTFDSLLSLATLTLMELILGIDNIVFLSVLTENLTIQEQKSAQRVGLTLALIMRIVFLFAISFLMRLTTPLFTWGEIVFSWRNLLVFGGGFFLIVKASHEIYSKIELNKGIPALPMQNSRQSSFVWIIAQIVMLDLVFSVDSVLTAIGMASHLFIMIIAMILSMICMLFFAPHISRLINRYPSMKILALAFLFLIGGGLIAEGLGQHLSKSAIYIAMGFGLTVEMLNIYLRTRNTGKN